MSLNVSKIVFILFFSFALIKIIGAQDKYANLE
jgi:uncharacterized membrane protein YjdF